MVEVNFILLFIINVFLESEFSPEEMEVISCTEHLLTAIREKDFQEYRYDFEDQNSMNLSFSLSLSSKLCSENVTCFEPESCSQMVTGLEFHKFYFENSK